MGEAPVNHQDDMACVAAKLGRWWGAEASFWAHTAHTATTATVHFNHLSQFCAAAHGCAQRLARSWRRKLLSRGGRWLEEAPRR
jgi:hypothetical protein